MNVLLKGPTSAKLPIWKKNSVLQGSPAVIEVHRQDLVGFLLHLNHSETVARQEVEHADLPVHAASHHSEVSESQREDLPAGRQRMRPSAVLEASATLKEAPLLCVPEDLQAVLGIRFDAPGHHLTIAVCRQEVPLIQEEAPH